MSGAGESEVYILLKGGFAESSGRAVISLRKTDHLKAACFFSFRGERQLQETRAPHSPRRGLEPPGGGNEAVSGRSS